MFTSLGNYCMSAYLQYCTPYPSGHATELTVVLKLGAQLIFLEIQSRQVWHFGGEKLPLLRFQT